jgi:hypothetical protein
VFQFEKIDILTTNQFKRKRLCNQYYVINEDVCREFVGKKLTAGLRNHLGELAEKVSSPLSLALCVRG